MSMDDHGTLSQCRKKLTESKTLSWPTATKPRHLQPKTFDPMRLSQNARPSIFCNKQVLFVLSQCFPCHFVDSLSPLDLVNCFSMGEVKSNTACLGLR